MRVLIHDSDTWSACQTRMDVSGISEILTESPAVFEMLRRDYNVKDISFAVSLQESREICGLAVNLAQDWQKVLNSCLAGRLPGREPGRIFSRDLANLMVRMMYHRTLLERIKRDIPVLVPYVDSLRGNCMSRLDTTLNCPYGVNYFGLVAQSGLQGVEALPVRRESDRENGELCEPSPITALQLVLLKLSSTSPRFIYRYLLKTWEMVSSVEFLRRRANAHIYIHAENDLLLHALPHLIRQGYSVSRVSFSQEISAKRHHINIWPPLLDATPDRFREALNPAAKRICELTNKVLLPAYDSLSKAIKLELTKFSENRRAAFLSGCVVDPFNVLMARCFSEQGVPSIQFQHGGIGLIDVYLKSQLFSDMAVSDGFVCFNPYERDFYYRYTRDEGVQFFVQGARREHGSISQSISRRIGRKLFGVRTKEKLVIFTPTRFKTGQIFANDIFDMKYWNWIRVLLEDGVRDTDCRFIVKVYQKGLWHNHASSVLRGDATPFNSLTLGMNTEIRTYPQLNYCRFAADLIVIDRATSTIGWALAADVPILYLETPFCRLLPEVREKMKEAVFVLDAGGPDWTVRIREHLNLSKAELSRQWGRKRSAREAFISDYVLGADIERDSLAQWIWKVHAGRDKNLDCAAQEVA